MNKMDRVPALRELTFFGGNGTLLLREVLEDAWN